jgi:DNA-binding GntR family transcriptional regulator
MDIALEQEDYKEFQRIHMLFNDALFMRTRNRHPVEILKQYWEYIVRTQNVSWSYKQDELKGRHWQVLRAIRTRDADSTERAMRNYVEACRQAYLECAAMPQR